MDEEEEKEEVQKVVVVVVRGTCGESKERVYRIDVREQAGVWNGNK